MKERILQLRKKLGMTQGEFGEKIGLRHSGVSNIENGLREVQDRHIRLILAAFPQVSEEWLREGSGDMFRAPSGEAERLARKYDFPDIVQKLLETYEGLTEEQQEAVLDYAQRFIASVVDEDDIEAKVEAYREELLLAKRGQRSSASQTGAGGII